MDLSDGEMKDFKLSFGGRKSVRKLQNTIREGAGATALVPIGGKLNIHDYHNDPLCLCRVLANKDSFRVLDVHNYIWEQFTFSVYYNLDAFF